MMKFGKYLAALFAVAVLAVSGVAWAGALPKPESKNPEAQKLIDQAWEVEAKDSNADIFKQCIDLMEKANAKDPKNAMILVDLSRYQWSYGDNLPKETKEQQKTLEEIYKKGLDYADQSLKIKDSAGGHYWYAVNLAASKEFSGIVSQAAAFPSIYSHSEKVKEIDADYYYGAPGRLWSEVLTRVPKAVVKMVGWDVQEAIDEINTAIKKHPKYVDNYVYKARFYYVYFEDKDQAIKILEEGLAIDPNAMPGEESANRIALRDGKELWKKITGKEYPNK